MNVLLLGLPVRPRMVGVRAKYSGEPIMPAITSSCDVPVANRFRYTAISPAVGARPSNFRNWAVTKSARYSGLFVSELATVRRVGAYRLIRSASKTASPGKVLFTPVELNGTRRAG